MESIIHGHQVYKYIWTPRLGERLSFHADVGNVHDSYHTTYPDSVIKDGWLGGGPHTADHLLCCDCRFCVTPWKLQITCYTVTCVSDVKCIHVIKVCLTDEYALNSEMCLTSGLYGIHVVQTNYMGGTY